MGNFTKSDLAQALATRHHMARSEALEIVDTMFDAISKQVADGVTVTLRGFGRFVAKDRPAREGRNPRTGETVQIPARRGMTFKPSKSR